MTIAASCGKKLPRLNRRQNPTTVANDRPTSAASAAGSNGRTLRLMLGPLPHVPRTGSWTDFQHARHPRVALERPVPSVPEAAVAGDTDHAWADEAARFARHVLVPGRGMELHDRDGPDLAAKSRQRAELALGHASEHRHDASAARGDAQGLDGPPQASARARGHG